MNEFTESIKFICNSPELEFNPAINSLQATVPNHRLSPEEASFHLEAAAGRDRRVECATRKHRRGLLRPRPDNLDVARPTSQEAAAREASSVRKTGTYTRACYQNAGRGRARRAEERVRGHEVYVFCE